MVGFSPLGPLYYSIGMTPPLTAETYWRHFIAFNIRVFWRNNYLGVFFLLLEKYITSGAYDASMDSMWFTAWREETASFDDHWIRDGTINSYIYLGLLGIYDFRKEDINFLANSGDDVYITCLRINTGNYYGNRLGAVPIYPCTLSCLGSFCHIVMNRLYILYLHLPPPPKKK